MGRIAERLAELGLELPRPFAAPPGVEFRFDLVHLSGGLGYVSGHLPMDGSDVLVTGRVGDGGLTVEQGQEAARLTGLSIFASLRETLGDLERVSGWVRALGLVQCAAGFDKPPAVINGFTDLVLDVWGPEAGSHARTAIGAAQLPFDVPVELEAIVEVR
jgi:enamine deaminase RidA (YjgF/YER057c/UK114 family)